MQNFLQANRALAAEENFTQVNRALAAEKNYYLNLNQIKSNPDGQPTIKANVTPRLPFDKKFFVKL